MTRRVVPFAQPDKVDYRLEFDDDFAGDRLSTDRWLPAHLPQWSSTAQAAARYRIAGGHLVLEIAEDQAPWCPEFDGATKVSSLQTGVFSGELGSGIGQHRFSPHAVVREEQQPQRLYTPQYGYVEVRARAPADPRTMVALWMIGYEDIPQRCGEICVMEIFGRDIDPSRARIGMGVHPFADPELTDDFERVSVDIDATDFHVYAAHWAQRSVDFFVDGTRVKSVPQSPQYPMQLMLGIYEFPADGVDGRGGQAHPYPKEFVVDHVRSFRAPR